MSLQAPQHGPYWQGSPVCKAFFTCLSNFLQKIPQGEKEKSLLAKVLRKELPSMFPKSGAPMEADAHFHSLIYLLTYLLTPRCRVLLWKLSGLQLVKKFPAFHGTRRFITALTSVLHLSLSWASPIQSIYPTPPPGDPSYYYPPIYA